MCLDDQILNTYLDGELAEPWRSQVEEHLSYCPSCKLRYEKLEHLKAVVKNAELQDSEIETRQERVMAVLEKNYLNKKKKNSFFKKQFKLSVSQLSGIAAAFVIVFVGSLSIKGNKEAQIIPGPVDNAGIEIANITPVKTYEPVTKSLNSYSLEEIIQNLDERGYDVDVRLKSITPIVADIAEPEEEPVEN